MGFGVIMPVGLATAIAPGRRLSCRLADTCRAIVTIGV
jgi:hypothetical protein